MIDDDFYGNRNDNIKEDYPELEGLEKFWNDENDTPENMRGYKKPRPKK